MRKYVFVLVMIGFLFVGSGCNARNAPAETKVPMRFELLAKCASADQLKRMTEEEIQALVETPACAEAIGLDAVFKLQPDGSYDSRWYNEPPSAPAGALNEQENSRGPEGFLSNDPEQIWASNSSYPASQVVPISAQEVLLRLTEDARHLSQLNPQTQVTQPTEFAYVSEYIAMRLALVTDQGEVIILGENERSALTWAALGKDFVLQEVTLDYLRIWADRHYFPNGNTTYSVTVHNYALGQKMLYVGTHIIELAPGKGVPYSWEVTYPNGNAMRSARYTVRHASEKARYVASVQGNTTLAYATTNTLRQAGYPGSFWSPLYGGIWPEPTYGWDPKNIYECGKNLPRGVDQLHGPVYPYVSKTCLCPECYIQVAIGDPLGRGLQALDMLNRYNDPDILYDPTGTGAQLTTPRQTIQEIYTTWWNGHGIRSFGKPEHISSGIRTIVYATLVAIQCNKSMVTAGAANMSSQIPGKDQQLQEYGDDWSCQRLQEVAEVMRQIQWGVTPFENYYGSTDYDQHKLQPTAQGAPFLAWTKPLAASGDLNDIYASYQAQQAPVNGLVMVRPSEGFLSEMIDSFGMRGESAELVVANYETAAAYWQFWRIITYYQYPDLFLTNPEIGNELWLPRGVIRLRTGTQLITIPADTSYPIQLRATDVLDQTGANYICAMRGEAGRCCEKNKPCVDFDIRFGDGYLVEMPHNFPWNYPGIGRSQPPSYNFIGGQKEYLGFPIPQEPNTIYTAAQLAETARLQGCQNVQLTKLNRDGTLQDSLTKNFIIEKTEGYLFYTSVPCSFTLP